MVLALRSFLSSSVSKASCERSFSKLKLIKTFNRTSMSEGRSVNLAFLLIERDLFKKMEHSEISIFETCLQNFARKKS